eukprot:NODE_136_length_16465_cov_1.184957.p1 type:complete len:1027 gc:universal NODE_136_length_16465_cov_1.184957:9207-12287(+)
MFAKGSYVKSFVIFFILVLIIYYLAIYVLAFTGLVSIMCIYFKLNLIQNHTYKEIPFLSIEPSETPKKIELKYSENVNRNLEDLVSLIIKDYFSWHTEMTKRPDFLNLIQILIYKSLDEIVERWKKVDVVDFINNKIFNIYLTHVRLQTKTKQNMSGDKRTFTHSKEFDYLFATRYADIGAIHKGVQISSATIDPSYIRHILNQILPYLIPSNEYHSVACKSIIVEVVAKTIIIPIMNMIAEPEFINSFIDMFCTHLLREMRMVKELRRALEANSHEQSNGENRLKSYEEFLLMIQNCQNLLEAKRIRDQIVMEIRRKRLLIGNRNSYDSINGVKIKKLIQYTNKLVIAKRKIEKRIIHLGGNVPMYENSQGMEPNLLDVLKSSVGLSYFSEFLDQKQAQKLLQLHLALEGIEHQLESFDEDSESLESLILDFTNLINTYFSNRLNDFIFPTNVDEGIRLVLLKLKEGHLDRISFALARSYLFNFIKESYFAKFKLSDLWLRMSSEFAIDRKDLIESDREDLEQMDESELLGTDAIKNVEGQLQQIVVENETSSIYTQLTPVSINPLSGNEETKSLHSDKSVHIESLTSQLQELNDHIDKLKQHEAILLSLVKSHGLNKQPSSRVLDSDGARVLLEDANDLGKTPSLSNSKSTFVLKALGSEDESLKILKKSYNDVLMEIRDLSEKKLSLENQGRDMSIKPGQVEICIDSWTKSSDGRKDFVLYLIRVKTSENNSWNIYRRYSEFLELHESLVANFPMIPYELPKKRPNLLYVGQMKDDLASTRQSALDIYLKNLTHHEDICQSLPFRKFLSQDVDNSRVVSTPQLITQSIDSSLDSLQDSPKKGFASFIQKHSSPIFGSPSRKSISNVSESKLNTPTDIKSSDGYKIISEMILELFDLQESVFRKHAVSVILNQIFGGVIEKKLEETYSRLCADEMLVFYLETLKEKLFTSSPPSKDVVDNHETKIKLELLFPELFGGFLGRNNSVKAAGKVFDSFQNEVLNLHVVSSLLLLTIKELFPEVERVL